MSLDWKKPWKMHIIDNQGHGADGVKSIDVTKNGYPDLVSGWEESGLVKLHINPGTSLSKRKWSSVIVGRTGAVEGVNSGDLDKDGRVDFFSFSEGKIKSVFVHWSPFQMGSLLKESDWKTEKLPAPPIKWMDGFAIDINGDGWLDIVAGGKQKEAEIGWLESPGESSEKVRTPSLWKYHRIASVGWVMTLKPLDMDGDGDEDILVSDRTNSVKRKGVWWLENPGINTSALYSEWKTNFILKDKHAMFIDTADLNGDSQFEVIVPSQKPNALRWFELGSAMGWEEYQITIPANEYDGEFKATKVYDIDQDSHKDILISMERGSEKTSNIIWFKNPGLYSQENWLAYPVAGQVGRKFDDLVLLDLDADGDFDVITTEEQHQSTGLGVIWYENPNINLR